MSEVGVIEEVLNEQLHSLDAANHELHEFRALIVLLIPVSPCQQFRIVCDGSQRFLQVVADGVRKLLKVFVVAAQRVTRASQTFLELLTIVDVDT